jgi:hypothetical protein
MTQAHDPTMTRRTVLTGAAAAAVPAIPVAAAYAADPIFAAIAEYRKTSAAFLERNAYEEGLADKGIRLPPASDEDCRTQEMIDIVDADVAAQEVLAETMPTTMAGILALVNLVAEESNRLGAFMFDGDEETLIFINTLAKALTGLMEGAQP